MFRVSSHVSARSSAKLLAEQADKCLPQGQLLEVRLGRGISRESRELPPHFVHCMPILSFFRATEAILSS